MPEEEKLTDPADEQVLQNTETSDSAHVQYTVQNLTEKADPKKPNVFQKFWVAYKTKKKLAIPLTVAILLAILFAIPLTRYAVLGLVITRDVSINVTDMQTSAPISGVEVSAHGKSAKTDAQGNATIKAVKVGKTKLTATKKYYKEFSSDITITLVKVKGSGGLRLEATGRQVPVHVTNKITGQNLEGAIVKAADTEAETNKDGIATLVLPSSQPTVSGKVSAKGYNTQEVQLSIFSKKPTSEVFAMTPSGKVYFLSKKSGRIDVVKTDLDGTNRQTILAGTGHEEDTNTILLASRDWKYLALQSRRDSDKAKLYIIDTSNDKLTEVDGGNSTYTPVGWHEHYFIYKVTRDDVLAWQPRGGALKTYNAENLQLTVIEETNAQGNGDSDYVTEAIDSVYILRDKLVYSKHWYSSYYSAYRLSDKRMGVYSVKPNGTGTQVIKDFSANNNGYISTILSKPDEVYFSVAAGSTASYYEYADGAVREAKDITSDSFSKFYPTYLASPGGQNTFWYEPRDGKNTLFTGTQDGSNPKEIASLSEYVPYGWYTDDYLLVSKGGSELFIMPAIGANDKGQILKVTDYHKPNYSFQGYGYGYGGI